MAFSWILVAMGIGVMLAGLISVGSISDEAGATRRDHVGGPVFVSGLIVLLMGLVGYGLGFYAITVRWTLMILAIILLVRTSPRR